MSLEGVSLRVGGVPERTRGVSVHGLLFYAPETHAGDGCQVTISYELVTTYSISDLKPVFHVVKDAPEHCSLGLLLEVITEPADVQPWRRIVDLGTDMRSAAGTP